MESGSSSFAVPKVTILRVPRRSTLLTLLGRCAEICGRFLGVASKLPQGKRNAVCGHLWPKAERGCPVWENHLLGGGQHRVCLVIGTADARLSPICGALPHTPLLRKTGGNNVKKDIKFSTRMASADREAIKEFAKRSGMSMSDYVTACCLGKQVVVIDGLKEVLKELKSIGRNLNQLVTLAHMGRVTVINLESVYQAFSELSNTVRMILERKRW